MFQQAYISLGGNLGNPPETFRKALKDIEQLAGPILSQSSLYQTAAWGFTQQPDFINQVIRIQTTLPPQKLLDVLLTIELIHGREREIHWGPRTLDLDLLFYNDLILNEENLTIPHPRIAERRFILIPMQEIAAEWEHPVFKKTIQELAETCMDESQVQKIECPTS